MTETTFPGVTWHDPCGSYKASIRFRGKTIPLGLASSVIEGASLILDYYDSVGARIPKRLRVLYDALLHDETKGGE